MPRSNKYKMTHLLSALITAKPLTDKTDAWTLGRKISSATAPHLSTARFRRVGTRAGICTVVERSSKVIR
jgi:hypothetical protein